MKQKILEALKQGYKNLGMSEEAFERVAAFGETFIKEEEQIATFVSGAGVLLKAEQSAADRVRTKASEEKKALETRIAELEAKLGGAKKDEDDDSKQAGNPEDLMAKFSAMLDEKLNPMRERLDKFEGEAATKSAIKTAKDRFFGNEYAKKYETERDDAWERAIEKFEDTGKKMTADELHDKAKSYFDKYVSRKGVDTSKPLESDGGNDDNPDFSPFDRAVAKNEGQV